MKLLILGGTLFMGRHLVDAALARGHELTLFNRGRHNPQLYPQVEKLKGDRDSDLSALQGRRWDAVIDTCGYLPQQVQATARLLSASVGHYTYISTISVYSEQNPPGVDESGALQMLNREQLSELAGVKLLDARAVEKYGAFYGPLKRLCEQAAEEALPGRVLNIRSGLAVGPLDYRDRFTYWVRRVAQGGEVLAPGRPARPVQFIDARDLAEWTIRLIEKQETGIYNATGPDYELNMRRFLEECISATTSSARLTWVSNEFLSQAGVKAMTEVPMWHPKESRVVALSTANCRKAFAAGLRFRPLAETIHDTLAWQATRPTTESLSVGLAPERERQLLEDWHSQSLAEVQW